MTRAFSLRRRERAFARELLAKRTQLWLYRCDQHRFCGDFVVVDRSAAAGAPMRCWAIELKSSARLRIGRLGIQLANCGEAANDVAAQLAVPVRLPVAVIGDKGAVMSLLSQLA